MLRIKRSPLVQLMEIDLMLAAPDLHLEKYFISISGRRQSLDNEE